MPSLVHVVKILQACPREAEGSSALLFAFILHCNEAMMFSSSGFQHVSPPYLLRRHQAVVLLTRKHHVAVARLALL